MMDKTVNYRPGAYIYIEGDENVESIFILKKGRVAFTVSNERIQRAKTHVSAGDIFGFINSFCMSPRMESAIAQTESTVIELSRENFIALIQKNSAIAFKVLNFFANELRAYDDMMFSVDGGGNQLGTETGLYTLAAHHYKTKSFNKAFYILKRYESLFPSGPRISRVKKIISDMTKPGKPFPFEPIKQGIYEIYNDNQMIFSEYEPGDRLFIVKEGSVTISKYSEGTEIILSVLKDGDIFGELAIVSDKPRNASAASYGRSTILPIDKKFLTTVISKSPEILRRIFVSISKRIWFTHIRLESKLYDRPITRVYSFLENKLLEENIPLKSRDPVTFNFGIDELLKMTGLTNDMLGESLNELMNDKNLNFNLGQIEIEKPSALITMSHFYKSRDSLNQGDDDTREEPAVTDNYTPEIDVGNEDSTDKPAKNDNYTPEVEVDYDNKQNNYDEKNSPAPDVQSDKNIGSTELFDEISASIE